MNRRKVFMTVIIVLIAIFSIASVITYFVLEEEKPWMAFYLACCGGVIVVNLIISFIFVYKNFKKNK